MSLRYYANAAATSLTSSCTAVATNIIVASTVGLPISYPYVLILDRGSVTEEVVLVTNGSGATLTVTRGYDSTTAFDHATGCTVQHGISAIDPREANAHVNATTGVHGLSGGLVGTTDTQTITNKTLGSSNTINGFGANRMLVSDGTGKAVPGSTLTAGAVVGTTDAQTLTNKILGNTNTLNGFTASRMVETDSTGKIVTTTKAIPAGAVVGTTDTQVLTHKDLTNSTNTFPATLVATSGVQLVSNKILVSCSLGLATAIHGTTTTVTTDASGNATISHAMGNTPTAILATSGNSGRSVQIIATSATTFTIHVNTAAGADYAGSFICRWMGFI